ncbi:polysaccharide pyruvyl transferase family protein, partial [Novosphingobium profundi]|uniref:polysaccharide pyruvyl transferase family protein n=1 Tax=Novosphingobium profundi TaxID=1774954 RepID=UPI001CFD31AB
RVPVVKCAQAMGPFRSRVNRLAARAILPRMRLIVSRGRITHGHVEALGIRPLQRGADLAFTLEHAPHRAEATPNEGLVGCAPSVVMHKKIDAAGGDYVAEMAQFITYLVESGRQVVLLPHSARAHTSASHNNDLPLCRSIHAALAPHVRTATRFSNMELSARELRTVIAGCDVFVTSRFHAMVSGLATGTPTLVLGWSHKYVEVLEMFGAEDFAIAHGDYSQECLRSRFTSLWQNREAMAARLREALPGVRAVAEQQLDAIAQVLGAGAARPQRTDGV